MNEEIIFSCPCGITVSTDISDGLLREIVRGHDAQHIERVLEIKAKTPTLPPLKGTSNPTPVTYITSNSETDKK